MRSLAILGIVMALSPMETRGEGGYGTPREYAGTSRRQCAPAPPVCAPPQAPCPPKQAVAEAAPQAAAGMFAAPPQSGEVVGESSSMGLRGFGIRFPAVTIELPTIQLPSLVRYRRGAEMYVDSARAPFVTGPAAVYGQVAPGGNALAVTQVATPVAAAQKQACSPQAQQAPGPRPAAVPPAPAAEAFQEELDEKDRRIDELERKLQKLEELEDCLRQVLEAQRNAGGRASAIETSGAVNPANHAFVSTPHDLTEPRKVDAPQPGVAETRWAPVVPERDANELHFEPPPAALPQSESQHAEQKGLFGRCTEGLKNLFRRD